MLKSLTPAGLYLLEGFRRRETYGCQSALTSQCHDKVVFGVYPTMHRMRGAAWRHPRRKSLQLFRLLLYTQLQKDSCKLLRQPSFKGRVWHVLLERPLGQLLTSRSLWCNHQATQIIKFLYIHSTYHSYAHDTLAKSFDLSISAVTTIGIRICSTTLPSQVHPNYLLQLIYI